MALSEKIRMGVMMVPGYAGAEAVRILSAHPGVRPAGLVTRIYAGRSFWEAYLHRYKHTDMI